MRLAARGRRLPRIEMVPLIDTFFLMLAFFISSVLSMEVVRGLPVELPQAGASAPIPKKDRVTVTLKADGRLELEGEPVSVEGLAERLRQWPGERQALQVGIRADRQTPYERVVEVLSSVKQAGVARAALMTAPVHGEPVAGRTEQKELSQ